MGIIDGIVDVVFRLDERQDRLAQGDLAQRGRAAGFLEEVAGTVDGVAAQLRAGDVPHGSCQRMRGHADALPAVLGPVLGDQDAEDLRLLLERSHDVESLLMELDQADDAERQLVKLERAAGMLHAEADALRAT